MAVVETPSGESGRGAFLKYWTADHGAPTLENMMLDSNAHTMDQLERPEILGLLPPLAGKSVLELGAGIGRFTEQLAQRASKVKAVDFVNDSCKTNVRNNEHFITQGKLEVCCADALSLDCKSESFDFIFSNWLFMYLSDEEAVSLASSCLSWLRPGGKLFLRESCNHPSGNAPRRFNPTQYRDTRKYFDIFHTAKGGDGSKYLLLRTNYLQSYARLKNNRNQVWWIWQKVSPSEQPFIAGYLTRQQYDYRNVMRYQKLFGEGLMSNGGYNVSRDIVRRIRESARQNPRVLEVGCGPGGNALHLAEAIENLYVHGIDFSGLLISILSARLSAIASNSNLQRRVTCSVDNILTMEIIPNSFDCIIARDVCMHFGEMDKSVFALKSLKSIVPGGGFLYLTDCFMPSEALKSACPPASPDLTARFAEYLEMRQYRLWSMPQMEALLKRAGFEHVQCIPMHEAFVAGLRTQIHDFHEENTRTMNGMQLVLGNPTDPELLQRSISNSIMSQFDHVRGSDATDAAAQAGRLDEMIQRATSEAVRSIDAHFKQIATEVEELRSDLVWADNLWNLKIQAATSGLLTWGAIVAYA